MKRYWDSSALIEVLYDPRIEALSKEPDQWTRPHALAEMFSTLTGGRMGFAYYADDAAELIKEITQSMNLVELTAQEVLSALEEAQRRGVRGGNIHDWLHARAAAKARVAELLTSNYSDFANLADGFSVRMP